MGIPLIVLPISLEATIKDGADTANALAKMHKTGNSLLLVMADGTLAGVIAMKDLMKLIAITTELERT